VTTSAVPGFIDQLVTVLGVALSGVTFIDGPFVTVPDGDYVCVGWSPYNTTAADATQVWSGIGEWGRDENFTLTCYLDSYSGASDAPNARRDASYALLADVETALRADPTMGGTVLSAQLAGHTLHMEQTDAGIAVGITFTLRVFTVI
jgi:hypothetical protein